VTSNVKASVPSRMYGLFCGEWTGLAETTLANFRTISLYFTLYCVLCKNYCNKNAEKLQNIKKCNLQRAHTQAHENVPEQTMPRVSNSHNIFKCQ
jgi:hypothetical protein